MGIKTLCFSLAVLAVLHSGLTVGTGQQQVTKIRSVATIVGEGSLSFPQKITLDRFGNLYILDSELSNIFMVGVGKSGGRVYPLCSPRTPGAAADLSVEAGGEVWILDSIVSKIVKLDRNCKVQRSFVSRHSALALQINAAGELIVLTSTGNALFELYDQNGVLLRSFGGRIGYGDPISDSVLSNGHLVADRTGGFYFSFNYPPVVRHYRRDGKLLGEFKPESNVYIGSPNIISQKQGSLLSVRANYQILVLDMTLDERGRLIFLLSGKPKSEAISQGSRNLLITTGSGKVLRKLFIEDASFHRLVAGRGALYLLRNRDGLRLAKYDLP